MKFIVFPGQASQYSGMGKDWFENFKEAQEVFEEASDFTGMDLAKLCFEGSDSDLKATEVTQPAILTTCIAIWRSLKNITSLEDLIKNSLFAGHSLGEYSALVAVGALSLGPTAKFVRLRGKAMQEAVPLGQGSMLALLFKPKTENAYEKALKICEQVSDSKYKVWVANANAAEQIVLSGHKVAIEKAQSLATSGPFDCRQAVVLDVSAPFHSPLMQPAAEKLKSEMELLPTHSSAARYIANVDAQMHALTSADDLIQMKKRLIDQVTASVLWSKSAEFALKQGAKKLVEIGPKKVLCGLCKRLDVNGQSFELSNLDRKEELINVQVVLSA